MNGLPYDTRYRVKEKAGMMVRMDAGILDLVAFFNTGPLGVVGNHIQALGTSIAANRLSDKIKERLQDKQSLEYRMFICLEDALKTTCEKQGLCYDDTDSVVGSFFIGVSKETASFTRESLVRILKETAGEQIDDAQRDTVLDVFGNAVLELLVKDKNNELWKYLIAKRVLLENSATPEKALGRFLTPSKTALVEDESVLGRDGFIKKLRARLWTNQRGGVRRLQLTGMGGIGKSQTLKLLYTQYATHPDMNAEDGVDAVGFLEYNGSMDKAIGDIGIVKQILEKGGTDSLERAWQYLRHLAETHSLLLLIDDVSHTITGKAAESAEDASFEKLFSLNIPVIFASRSPWQGFEEVRTPPLSLETLQKIYKEAQGDEVPADSTDSLHRLFEERAGCNTLVVQRLGSITKKEGFGIAGLWEHLDKIDFTLRFSDGDDDECLQREIDKLYSLDGLMPPERSILEAFSFFPARMLTMDTCVAWLKEDAEVSERILRKTLTGLVSNTWLQGFTPPEAGSPLISIHQLVATAVSHQDQPSALEHGGLIDACAKSLSYDVKEGFQAATPFVAAAGGIAAHLAREIPQKDDRASDEQDAAWVAVTKLFGWLGRYCNDVGDFQTALNCHEKALEICGKALGKRHPATATSCNNVAMAYHTLGDYNKALKYLKKALEISEDVFGEGHMNMALGYNNVALVYNDLGDYSTALEYLKKALGIREKVLGEEHVDTALSYNNIALVYRALGDYNKALRYHKKALGIREKVLGEEHVDTAVSYNNIAMVYYALRDYSNALVYLKKALEIYEDVLGEEHVKTATSCDNIALVYSDLGNYNTALRYHGDAARVFLAMLGPEHYHTRTALKNMYGTYRASGGEMGFVEWYASVFRGEGAG
jgi:tetratricopeptide (TPR) repeat protein